MSVNGQPQPSAAPSRAIVAVFARPCVPGSTKTRLAASIGPEPAARLAAAFFADTWDTVAGIPWVTPILTCPGDPVGLVVRGEVWPQEDGDLGSRLVAVFARGLARAPAVIALGADAPTLPPSRLEDLRRALAEADAAFVPARDGGFVALALRRCPAEAFTGVAWGTSRAHRDLARNLRSAGLSVVETEPWFDVDDVADLEHLAATPELARIAPWTAATLHALTNAPSLWGGPPEALEAAVVERLGPPTAEVR